MNEELRRKLLNAANEHLEVMDVLDGVARANYVKAVINAVDVVFGAFSTPSSLDGVGLYLSKGGDKIWNIEETGEAGPVTITAIPCLTFELAVRAKELFGDQDSSERRLH